MSDNEADDYVSEDSEDDEEDEPDELQDELQEEAPEDDEEESWQPIVQKINENDRNHRIIRVVAPELRRSSNIIQFPEMVEAIGIRISQIEQGSKIFTDYAGIDNVIDIARKEFFDRKNPLTLVRPMRMTETEIWVEKFEVRDMIFPTKVV